MKSVAVIGCGFSGLMTGVHLIRQVRVPFRLYMVDAGCSFGKGVAYRPSSERFLMNVTACKMSAFGDRPGHFCDWLSGLPEFSGIERNILENSFISRYHYGMYLESVWAEASAPEHKNNAIIFRIEKKAGILSIDENRVRVTLDDGEWITADYCILATGNQLPDNPIIKTRDFYSGSTYYRDPWCPSAMQNVSQTLPVLIIGNGLTMADTLIGLMEQGFTRTVFSISRHSECLLPQQNNHLVIQSLEEKLASINTLRDILILVNRYKKTSKGLGLTAEPLMETLRPHITGIWRNFNQRDKSRFLYLLSRKWDNARHRIPLSVFMQLTMLRKEGKWVSLSGTLTDIRNYNETVEVTYRDSRSQRTERIIVSRVINCTGPGRDTVSGKNKLLRNCIQNGILSQDHFRLGLEADPGTLQTLDCKGNRNHNIFAVGPLLKGIFYESTAVREIREQTRFVATWIADHINIE